MFEIISIKALKINKRLLDTCHVSSIENADI